MSLISLSASSAYEASAASGFKWCADIFLIIRANVLAAFQPRVLLGIWYFSE